MCMKASKSKTVLTIEAVYATYQYFIVILNTYGINCTDAGIFIFSGHFAVDAPSRVKSTIGQ